MPCRSSHPAPVQDMIHLEIEGRKILVSLHGNGALRGWDLLSQKRVFEESLLAEGLLDSTVPLRIAAAPFFDRESQKGPIVNISVVFAPRTESSFNDSNCQVSQYY